MLMNRKISEEDFGSNGMRYYYGEEKRTGGDKLASLVLVAIWLHATPETEMYVCSLETSGES